MRRTTTMLAAALALTVGSNAQAAELRVLTSGAIKAALADIKPLFEQASEHKLIITSDTSGRIAKRIAEGEETDLIIVTSSGIDDLIKQGKVVAGSKAVLARSGIGAVVRKGAPKPDISTPEKFKQALLAAKTVAYTSPASGGRAKSTSPRCSASSASPTRSTARPSSVRAVRSPPSSPPARPNSACSRFPS